MSPAKHANMPATTKQVALIKSTHSESVKDLNSTETEFQIIIEQGTADKLSPKSTGKIYFQLARHQDDQTNYLRITGNDGGGLHSREWIALDKVIATLSGQAGHPFKSSVLKTCMVGKSANNVSFLAAILRSGDIKLLKPSEKSLFHHVLVDDFEQQAASLQKRTK